MSDAYRSAQFKVGIVKENDPKKGRSRVQFPDEDGAQSHWLRWNVGAAGGSKLFNQPDLESEVNCLVDRHGIDGAILGASYNAQDQPPTQNGRLLKALLEGGLDFEYDKAAGTLTLKVPAGISIDAAAGVSIKGPLKTEGAVEMQGAVTITGAALRHNGKNVGSDHIHGGVQPGGGQTSDPAN